MGSAQKIFEATSESLYDFVSKNGRGLYVPAYQRDYAWDKSNVERLIADTVQGLSALIRHPDESITFIGTIITINDAKKSTISPLIKSQVYSQVMTVIDGQQRLTTVLMVCLAALVEIEAKWAELRKSKATVSDETKAWLETRVNDMRGLLTQMLAEQQNNGEGAYRYFPKMIRSFVDTWSYEQDKARYTSPIAWLLFEFVKFRLDPDPTWSRFIPGLLKTADEPDSSVQRRHFVKLMKGIRSKLAQLPANEEFPNLREIARFPEQQETLFGEEFPKAMRDSLLAQLEAQPGTSLVLDDGGELDLTIEDAKAKKWWEAAVELLALLFFAKFALERITLVVVTATTEDFAFDVFEALNTTGQPLTAIETFTPKVVQAVTLPMFEGSEEKKQLDIAQAYLKRVAKAEERQKRSAELLVAFALAESGEKLSKSLSEQRRFMRDSFDKHKGSRPEQQRFLRHLAELCQFFERMWVDKEEPGLAAGIKVPDPASVCLRFLVDLNHTITAPVLAQYAAAVNMAEGDEAKKAALKALCEVILAVTAFATLWRAPRPGTDGIDSVYRTLMEKGSATDGVIPLARSGRGKNELPSPSAIRAFFVRQLTTERAHGGGGIAGKQEWIEKVAGQPIYDTNETLARFLLFLAFDDVVEGENGTLLNGKLGCHPTLTLSAWNGPTLQQVEHIAPSSRAGSWAHSDLYGDDEYERLGNLTLLPADANKSVGARSWDQKRTLYAALGARTPEEAKRHIEKLKSLGVELSEKGHEIHGRQYLPHLNALGNVSGEWTLASVEARGRALAELAWNRAAPWLNLPT